MKRCRRALLVMFGVGVPAGNSGAQVARGVVTEQGSASPVAGVVISLERAAAPAIDSATPSMALSDSRGAYSIRTATPGRYHISAKRIGVKRFVSADFDLGPGETKRVDIVLDMLAFALPPVVVSTTPVCLTRPDQALRVASLWDEARTALTATRISLRDRLFKGSVTRYVRQLDPKNLRVLSESRSDMTGVFYKPSSMVSADSLSKVGYWWELPDSSAVYNAPDAEVLSSRAFLSDHCFDAVDGSRNRRGLVGIAFGPRPERSIPDIRGTLWLDARTFELRLLEYRYTQLRTSDSTNIGGELSFSRLPNGAWLVRRWFIRMPQFAHFDAPLATDLHQPMVLLRPTLYRLVEDGGEVFAEGLRLFDKPATITGVVLDSTGAGLARAVVSLAGTPFTTMVDDEGRFRLDGLPAGSHTVVAEHPGYAALGMLVGDQSLALEEGETQRVTIRGARTEDIVSRLCEGRPRVKQHGTLRLTVLDQDSGAPLGGLGVGVRWPLPAAEQTTRDSLRFGGIQSRTDAMGVVAFCDLPTAAPLAVHVLGSDDRSVHIADIVLGASEVAARTIKARRPE